MLDAIDLFAGAGGLSIGLEKAGFEVRMAVESDADAAATYRTLHPEAKVHEADIATASFSGYEAIDLVAGGPPCQPFSVGGKRLAEEDPRNGFPQFIRAVAETRPRAFILENVAGVIVGGKRAYFEWTLRELKNLGYKVTWESVNAADFGVPQRRQRVIAVGVRDGAEFVFPKATHGEATCTPWIASGSILDPCRPLGPPNKAKVTYAKRPDLRPSPYDGHLFNGGGRPLDLAKPSRTLLASMGGNKTPWIDVNSVVPAYHQRLLDGHPPNVGEVPGARRLTVRETALLQGFGTEVVFQGRTSSQYRQIGNAVPPALAAIVCRQLANHLDLAGGPSRFAY